MDKFEYTMRTVDKVNKPLAVGDLVIHCQEAGEEGWELVQIIEDKYSLLVQSWVAILKRKVYENK